MNAARSSAATAMPSALVFPKFLTASYKINFVDQRLFTAKSCA